MSPAVDIHLFSSLSFPRVSGDEPVTVTGMSNERLFSPRERG